MARMASSLTGGEAGFWSVFFRKKVWRGGVWFLLGILSFLACFRMVFCGQFVVVCVVNVVVWRALFRGRKIRHVLNFIFFVDPFGTGAVELGQCSAPEG
jgi:hypothetical protein